MMEETRAWCQNRFIKRKNRETEIEKVGGVKRKANSADKRRSPPGEN